MRRATVTALAVAGLLVGTAGCGVTLERDEPPGPERTDRPTAAAESDGPDDGGQDGATRPAPRASTRATPGGADAGGAPAAPGRAALRPEVTRTTTCPAEGLVVDGAGAAVEVTGSCSLLTVAGAGAVVVAEDVQRLVVDAADARVAVRTADEVAVLGAGSSVTWESGAPRVDAPAAGATAGAAATP